MIRISYTSPSISWAPQKIWFPIANSKRHCIERKWTFIQIHKQNMLTLVKKLSLSAFSLKNFTVFRMISVCRFAWKFPFVLLCLITECSRRYLNFQLIYFLPIILLNSALDVFHSIPFERWRERERKKKTKERKNNQHSFSIGCSRIEDQKEWGSAKMRKRKFEVEFEKNKQFREIAKEVLDKIKIKIKINVWREINHSRRDAVRCCLFYFDFDDCKSINQIDSLFICLIIIWNQLMSPLPHDSLWRLQQFFFSALFCDCDCDWHSPIY